MQHIPKDTRFIPAPGLSMTCEDAETMMRTRLRYVRTEEYGVCDLVYFALVSLPTDLDGEEEPVFGIFSRHWRN